MNIDVEGSVRKTPEQLIRAIVKNDAREMLGLIGNKFLSDKDGK